MGIRTIIVDNDPGLLEKLRDILREQPGVELLGCFENPVRALEYAKENPVELVFSDVVMPEISGITLAARLSELTAPPAVVLMSDIPGLSMKTWKIHAIGFMAKPYTRRDVCHMLDEFERSLLPSARSAPQEV